MEGINSFIMTTRKIAILIGTSIFIMAIAAGVGYGFIHNQLFSPNNPGLTFQNIAQNQNLLPLSVFAWLIIIITDLLVSWGLYKTLAPHNKSKAALVGVLRLVYTFILITAVIQLWRSYWQENVIDAYQLMESFETIWFYGLIIFGVHLYYLGKTSCYQKVMPLWINGLLVFSGIGYVVLDLGKLYFPGMEWVKYTEMVLVLPLSLSELSLAVWLLIKGGRK